MWNTDTIEGMEQTAKNEASHDCNVRIRGEWLEVQYNNGIPKFYYKWGKNYVTRNVAKNILESR